VAAAAVPAEVAAALRHPALREVDAENLSGSGEVNLEGRKFLVTCVALPETQGWRVGIVAPEDFYLRDLARTRRRLLAVSWR
jgi:hypothetical protein